MDFYIRDKKKYIRPLYVATVPIGSGNFARIIRGMDDEGLEIKLIEKKSGRDPDIRIAFGGGESYREELEEAIDEREHYGKRAEVREHKSPEYYQERVLDQFKMRQERAVGRTRFVVPDAELFRLLTKKE